MIPIATVVLVIKRFPQNTCIKCIFCQFIQYSNVPSMKDSLQPEIDDLRFYYRVCKQKYKNKTVYRSYLCVIHKMILVSLRKRSDNYNFYPGPLDPNFYCRVCKSTRKALNKHRDIHFMKLDSIHFACPNTVIDLKSPDFYCTKCNKPLINKYTFERHLQKIHALHPLKFPYLYATIDILDPKIYCAMCDKHLSRKQAYNLHLKYVRNLDN